MSGLGAAVRAFGVRVEETRNGERDVKDAITKLKAKLNSKDAKHLDGNKYKVVLDLKLEYASRALLVGNKVVETLKPELDPNWSIEVVDYEGVQDSHFCELHFIFTV